MITTKSIFTFLMLQRAEKKDQNKGSASYGSSRACDIWPLTGIFFIWIDKCKNDIPWVIFSPRVNGITVILAHHCHSNLTYCFQHLPCGHFVSKSWHCSVLVGEFWGDSFVLRASKAIHRKPNENCTAHWTKRCFLSSISAVFKRDFEDVHPKNFLSVR